ncbi:MAG: hypothetical protein LBO05_03435 [Deltaproteobacteria bacterium]|nr:hypothetical protein [Deltaproteobacteria bacterium]
MLNGLHVSGGNPQPGNGRVVGHVIGSKFVPKVEKTAASGPEALSHGSAALVRSVTRDILPDLPGVYPAQDAHTIMSVATLRVIRPSVTAGRMSARYKRAFVCQNYPGIALSPNTICAFMRRLGQDGSKRRQFYQKRLEMVLEERRVAIDGTPKRDAGAVNVLSEFFCKARLKELKEISLLRAYDIELMEPICADIFPGDSIDASSYSAFIRDNNIMKGIIAAGKGFPPSRIEDLLIGRPKLNFLTPIKHKD